VKTPRTRYVKTSDGAYIAYQVVGDGPDLVWQFDYFGNVDAVWDLPSFAYYLGGFAEFSRLILLDRRGTGQSSRNVPPSDLETRASDLRAVLDVLKADIVVAGGHRQGGAASAVFAATEPDRVRSFVWDFPQPRSLWAPDYPWGVSRESAERSRLVTEEYWGTDALFATQWALEGEIVPTEATMGIGKLSRSTTTPDVALEMDCIWLETDVRGVLPSVRVPALLTELDAGDRGEIDYVASLMPKAQVVRIPGEDEFQLEYIDRTHEAIRSFLGLATSPSSDGRILATLLFTDIVDSTKRAPRSATTGGSDCSPIITPGRGRSWRAIAAARSTRPVTASSRRSTDPLGPCAVLRRSRHRCERSASRCGRACTRVRWSASTKGARARRPRRRASWCPRGAVRSPRVIHGESSRRRIGACVRRRWRARAEGRSRPLAPLPSGERAVTQPSDVGAHVRGTGFVASLHPTEEAADDSRRSGDHI
jgi:pimeloyl-ACP methyl ester carboxylesterase